MIKTLSAILIDLVKDFLNCVACLEDGSFRTENDRRLELARLSQEPAYSQSVLTDISLSKARTTVIRLSQVIPLCVTKDCINLLNHCVLFNSLACLKDGSFGAKVDHRREMARLREELADS